MDRIIQIEEPPSSVDTKSRVISALGSMVGQFKGSMELLGNTRVPVTRGFVFGRCLGVLKSI